MAKTALIVDDSNSMRRMLGITLNHLGFNVTEAINGQEGLDQLAKLNGGKVDLIMTDLNMPVMDGLEFIREVRARKETKFTPILMLTTESGDDRKKAGKAAGATGWIVKPYHPDQLSQVIDKVVSK